MRGSRNFHERGSNENGNFWSQTRGGVGGSNTQKIPKLPFFLGKIFKFQGGGVRTPGPPLWIRACCIGDTRVLGIHVPDILILSKEAG